MAAGGGRAVFLSRESSARGGGGRPAGAARGGGGGAARGPRGQLHGAGIGAGERAVALNAERVEGHFWVGVNLALFAENSGGLRGLRALRWARAELKMAAKVNEAYHDAGPLR